MGDTLQRHEWRTRAATAATAWLNAAVAASQDDARPVLYRTLGVEWFQAGVQLVGCDGTMLFRTWAPFSDIGDLAAGVPAWPALPLASVVVLDHDKFALGFMRTLLSALDDDGIEELVFTIEEEPVDVGEPQPPLGEELRPRVLTMEALGQRLSCTLYEGEYPNWRQLDLGIDAGERVQEMVIGRRLFQAVGKLKGVDGIHCHFQGEDRAIAFTSAAADAHVSGLLMPMRRPDKPKKEAPSEDQLEAVPAGGPALVH